MPARLKTPGDSTRRARSPTPPKMAAALPKEARPWKILVNFPSKQYLRFVFLIREINAFTALKDLFFG